VTWSSLGDEQDATLGVEDESIEEKRLKAALDKLKRPSLPIVSETRETG